MTDSQGTAAAILGLAPPPSLGFDGTIESARRQPRVWTYSRGEWAGPLVMRGGDEFARRTLAFRLPGERGLVVALWAWRCRCAALTRWHTAGRMPDRRALQQGLLAVAPGQRRACCEEWA